MKKVMAICLMMIMVLTMSANVFAAPGAFVKSPSGNPAPEVVDFEASDEDCTGDLVVTPFGDRDDLPEELRELFEDAYDDIINTDDLTDLNAELAKIAADMGIAGEDLAVSDLFNLHTIGCEDHEGHGEFDITLSADTLSRFVALLQLNKDGEWVLVNATVTNNGEHLKFSADPYGPFAIIVDTSSGTPDAPQTGDNSMIYIYAIIMAVSVAALVVITAQSRKQRA